MARSYQRLEQHITPGEYKVQDDGTVTMTYVDGNGQTVQDQTAKITGIATDAAVKAAKTEVVKGTNIASVTDLPVITARLCTLSMRKA